MKSMYLRATAVAAGLFLVPAAASAVTFTNTTGGATSGTDPYTLTATESGTFSILRFIPTQIFTFAEYANLTLNFDNIQGGVSGGAPRIAVVVDNNHDAVADGQFLIHLGPAGSPFTNAALGAQSSGNLIGQNDNGRYDLGGIGGSAYTDYNAALALAGGYDVLRFSVILDTFAPLGDKTIVIASDGLIAEAAAAVPEPATWAMLIGGFGMIGGSMRSSIRRQKLSYRTA